MSSRGPERSRNARRREFGHLLWRLSDLVAAAERRRSFRAKAYRRAVWSLDDLDPDLNEPVEDLVAVPGIGPGVASLIAEFRDTGTVSRYDQLAASLPSETAVLRRLPRMTPAILQDLKIGLGIDTRADLVGAIESGATAAVRGVGETTSALWEKILMLPPHPGAVPAHHAWVLASDLARHLGAHLGVDVALTGQVRRVSEWVDTVELLVVTDDPGAVEAFLDTTAVLASGETTGTHRAVAHDGTEVRIHPTAEASAGGVLLASTGPPAHARALLDGTPVRTETEAYERAGSPVIPPPARGLASEIAAGVVRTEDLTGDLHVHSEASPDGRLSLEAIARAGVSRGHEYILITDHTVGLRFGGLDAEALAAQAEEIARVQLLHPGLVILHGAELNIGPDGSLDIDDDTLTRLDLAVAGVHSHFGLEGPAQTERVVRALSHPKVKVLAHPTGRRIGIRPGLDLDLEVVIATAVAEGVALESNGHRDRLDLPADWIVRADAAGAWFAANSDAHRPSEIGNVANAVATLQRAGVRKDRVVNAMAKDDFLAWAGALNRSGGEGGI